MLLNRIIYAVFLAACLGFSMAYTSSITAVLLVVAVSYPIAAAGFTAVQLAFLNADFTDRRITVPKNTPFEFCVSVKNASIFPCVPLELACSLPDPDSGRFIKKRIYVSLSPLSSANLIVAGRHLYRGCYTATAERISAIDPLRIIRLSKKLNKQMTMVFLPRKLPLEDALSSSMGEQNYSRPNAIIAEKEDFSHVRVYRPGDNIQLMHWKLTAKQDDFMIKQYDSVNDRRVFVLCDWSGGMGSAGGDSFLRADTIIETALAFVQAALDCGIHSTVQLGQPPDFETISVTSASEYDGLYDVMSILPVTADSSHDDFLALADDTDMNRAAAVVLITANLSEEIIFRARRFAKSGETYLVFVNPGSVPVDKTLYEEPFLFFNIRGSGEEALRLAAAMAKMPE